MLYFASNHQFIVLEGLKFNDKIILFYHGCQPFFSLWLKKVFVFEAKQSE